MRQFVSRHADALSATAAAALSVAGAVLAQELWRISASVPMAYVSDGQLFLAVFKATLANGWYLHNPDLGFPLGSDWHDYPVFSGDNLNLLLVHFLSLLSPNYVTVLHLFYVLGYALTAVSAFAAMRWLGISRGPAVVCATLFALLPYHLVLLEAHPFVTAYWVVPIASALVLAILLGRPLFARRQGADGSRLRGLATRTTLATLLACVLIASAGSNYYSVFAVGLVLLAGVVAALRGDWRRSLATAGVVAATILAAVALNALPNLVYEARHGANGEAAARAPVESERLSLTLFGLIVPSDGHRIGPLADLRSEYVESSPTPEVAAAPGIGVVAALGLLSLLGFALVSTIRARPWRERWRLHGAAAAAALIGFLIATTGGLSLLFAHVVSPQLRTWHRFHVFIAFFALVAVAVLLDMALRRLGPTRRGRAIAMTLLAVVLVVGFLDQTNPSYVPAYEETRAEFESDAVFVTAIEGDLGPGAAVFQLPYVPFPEWHAVGDAQQFDAFRGYLHSTDLRWSYGATIARPEDWQPGLIDETVAQMLPRISAVGFQGVVVDRRAYPDDAAALERALRRQAEVRPAESPNGRFSFFDLRPYGERLRRAQAPEEIERLRVATLEPLVAEPGAGLTRLISNGAFSPAFQMLGPTGELRLVNPSSTERAAMLELALDPGAGVSVDLSTPTGETSTATGRRPLRDRLSLSPGVTTLELEARGDAGPGAVHVRLYDAGIEPLETGPDGITIQP